MAGNCWHIKHAFAVAKSEVRLDEYEVRTAHGWARHVTLAPWGLALLSMAQAHSAALLLPPPKNPCQRSLTASKRARGADFQAMPCRKMGMCEGRP